MSQAIVDPVELRRFAHNLKKFNQELEERMTALRAQLTSLGATWRDQEHVKFVQEFEQTLAVMQRYVEAANLHIPFLMRKAQRVMRDLLALDALLHLYLQANPEELSLVLCRLARDALALPRDLGGLPSGCFEHDRRLVAVGLLYFFPQQT